MAASLESQHLPCGLGTWTKVAHPRAFHLPAGHKMLCVTAVVFSVFDNGLLAASHWAKGPRGQDDREKTKKTQSRTTSAKSCALQSESRPRNTETKVLHLRFLAVACSLQNGQISNKPEGVRPFIKRKPLSGPNPNSDKTQRSNVET